jgi:hypothetical protein
MRDYGHEILAGEEINDSDGNNCMIVHWLNHSRQHKGLPFLTRYIKPVV